MPYMLTIDATSTADLRQQILALAAAVTTELHALKEAPAEAPAENVELTPVKRPVGFQKGHKPMGAAVKASRPKSKDAPEPEEAEEKSEPAGDPMDANIVLLEGIKRDVLARYSEGDVRSAIKLLLANYKVTNFNLIPLPFMPKLAKEVKALLADIPTAGA